MNAEHALLEVYREWYRLAKACGSAIRVGNRELLRECQSRAQKCQSIVARLTGEVREEWRRSGVDCNEKENRLGELVSGLMAITRENLELIRQRREFAGMKLAECAAAGSNLKRLKTYAVARQSNWASFS